MTDKEILIQKGKTFSLVVRWETEPIVRKAITAISLATGAPRLTISSHGIPDGWNGTVYGVEGMKQINDVGVQQLTVIDSNTIELNGVTPIDDNGKMWSAYTSGGFVKFYTPKSLSGYTARMDIKDKIGGTVWASSEIADTPYDIIDIALDDVAKTITLTIDAVDTAALTAKKGVADLELVSSGGVVTKLKLTQGGQDEPDPVRVAGEVTT